MKTVYTVLPIYDSLTKQCFERGKKGGVDKPVPVITPRWRLPSFQWLDDGDGANTVTNVELIGENGEAYDIGLAYSHWSNSTFTTFVSSGLNITSAVKAAGAGTADIHPASSIYLNIGDTVVIRGVLTRNAGDGGNAIQISITDGAGLTTYTLNNGDNVISHVIGASGFVDMYINGTMNPDFSFTGVEVNFGSFNNYFQTMPTKYMAGTDAYFMYNGDTLNYLLPYGMYYLRITTDNGYVYYSDWFVVKCFCDNLISSLTNVSYNTFTVEGTEIVLATKTTAGDKTAVSNSFAVRKDDEIHVVFYGTLIAGTWDLAVSLNDATLGVISNVETTAEGLTDITLTVTDNSDDAYILFTSTQNVYFNLSEVFVYRDYCEDLLKISFTHSCDLGDIKYEDGFLQVLYLESEALEPTFPYVEKGQENGYGEFVPTWQRQDKVYVIRTKLLPQFIIDVLHRLKLHDTIAFTDNVGDSFTVEEIETEQEWQFNDKYYATATINLNLGEKIIVTGCCSDINVCESGGGGGVSDDKYIQIINLSGSDVDEDDFTTTLTTEPYAIMLLDSAGNDITCTVTIRFALSGGVYHVYIYSSDPLTGVKMKITY